METAPLQWVVDQVCARHSYMTRCMINASKDYTAPDNLRKLKPKVSKLRDCVPEELIIKGSKGDRSGA
eukprot:5256488-Amphidinium_carterae.1